MNRYEKNAIRKMLEGDRPHISGPSYDENFRQIDPGEDPKLLDDPNFKRGFQQSSNYWKRMMDFLLTATTKDLVKYAGKPKQTP